MDDNIVLRTHTSPVQARIMTTRKPPIRIICPGRVYRADEADATHSPVFHQMEGLVIDEGITMGDLKGTLDEFAAPDVSAKAFATRFRPSFFPFTEPSAEVDLTCANCERQGLPHVQGHGLDRGARRGHGQSQGAGHVRHRFRRSIPASRSAWASSASALLKYNIPNLRYLYENDLRFLTQFR